MKRTVILITVIVVFGLCFVGTSISLTLRNIAATDKLMEYFDNYKAEAEAYILSSPEMQQLYGADMAVVIDESVRYTVDEATDSNRYRNVFNPQAPESIEEFSAYVQTIEFDAKVNGDDYTITFTKDAQGKLLVSSLVLATSYRADE